MNMRSILSEYHKMQINKLLGSRLKQYTLPPFKMTADFHEVAVKGAVQKTHFLLYVCKLLSQENRQLFQTVKSIARVKHPNLQEIRICFEEGDLGVWVVETGFGPFSNMLDECKGFQQADGVLLAKQLIQAFVELKTYKIVFPYIFQHNVLVAESGLLKLGINSKRTDRRPELQQLKSVLESILIPNIKSELFPAMLSMSTSNFLKGLPNMSNAQLMATEFFKDKIKPSKKSFKGYIFLRVSQNDQSYGTEKIIFAVSHSGFFRIRICPSGLLQESSLKLLRSNIVFLNTLRAERLKDSIVFISQYPNQGTLQNYLNRLKSKFSVDKIYFIIYSLLNFLMSFQTQGLLSHNFLHPRYIYLHNGLLRLGEPTPLSKSLKSNLYDLRNVNDYFFPEMKRELLVQSPQALGVTIGEGPTLGLPQQWLRPNRNDLWSIGMICYTIMYGENAIFPEGRVRLPINPVYPQPLKRALQLLLQLGEAPVDAKYYIDSIEFPAQIRQSQIKQKREIIHPVSHGNVFDVGFNQIVEYEQVQVIGLTDEYKQSAYSLLDQSIYKYLRLVVKWLLVWALYIGLFFLPFLIVIVPLINQFNALIRVTLTVNNLSSSIFTLGFTQSLNSIYELQTVYNCINASNWHNEAWSSFPGLSLGLMAFLLLCKGLQFLFDTVKFSYEAGERWLCNNYLLFLIIKWTFCQALFSFFYMFAPFFFLSTSPCLSNVPQFEVAGLLRNQISFFPFAVPHIANLVLYLLAQGVVLTRSLQSNLIQTFLLFFLLMGLLATFIVLRVGVVTEYYPSFLNNSLLVYSLNRSYSGYFQFFPELLMIGEVLLQWCVDWVFLWLQPRVKVAEQRYFVQRNGVTEDHDNSMMNLKD